jgi:LPS-assembly lipoprotein
VPIKKLAIFVVILLLSACGYHLRGALDLPENLKKITLEGGSPALREAFNQALRGTSAQATHSPEEAGIIIHVVAEDSNRRALSLSTRGRSNELELYYRLDYQLSDASANLANDKQSIEIRREYYNDQQAIIAKENEEAVIQNEMYQQAVRTIINRIRVVLEKHTK